MQRLLEARQRTDRLFDLVREEALYVRPVAERHRIVFYLGHLEAFDWNLLRPALGLKDFDAALNKLFAFGIDPVDGALPSDHPSDWPKLEQVKAYRRQLRERLDAGIAGSHLQEHWLHVAVEHRLMHLETLAYMLHRMPYEQKHREAQAGVAAAGPAQTGMMRISGGAALLGLEREQGFGWDNEFAAHHVQVSSFDIDRYKTTNGQYLEFMERGGYNDPGLWLDEDWKWKTGRGIDAPAFWKKQGNGWLYRGMFDEEELPLNSPVYVSHAEARAFARWAQKRLPSEAEWQRAAYDEGRCYPWGAEAPGPHHGYFDFARWDPYAVNAFPRGRSAAGVEGMLANGWEWTSTPFAPFAGFEAFDFYPGYSANFFDGKHYVLKGGSTRTDRSMLRASFRNWFQPHYQYVYAGFRCARSL